MGFDISKHYKEGDRKMKDIEQTVDCIEAEESRVLSPQWIQNKKRNKRKEAKQRSGLTNY